MLDCDQGGVINEGIAFAVSDEVAVDKDGTWTMAIADLEREMILMSILRIIEVACTPLAAFTKLFFSPALCKGNCLESFQQNDTAPEYTHFLKYDRLCE